MKTVKCSDCGREEEIRDKVKRKHCLWCGIIMDEVEGVE